MSNTDCRWKNPPAKDDGFWRRADRALFGPIAASVAMVFGALTVLGCMNFGSIPPAVEVKVTDDPGVLAQDGKLPARPGKEQVVYYPVPYASPPNLQIADPANVCDIVDQRENCFVVHFHPKAKPQDEVTWTARGSRKTPAGDAQPGGIPTPGTPVSEVPIKAGS
jgi:hypothetical protein